MGFFLIFPDLMNDSQRGFPLFPMRLRRDALNASIRSLQGSTAANRPSFAINDKFRRKPSTVRAPCVKLCPPLKLNPKMPPVRTAKKNSASARAQPSGRKTPGSAATNPSVPTPQSPAEARSDAPELLVHANASLPELGSSTYDGFFPVAALRPPPKVKVANAIHFRSNAEWEEGWRTKIGRPTKKLKFGSSFVLTEGVFETQPLAQTEQRANHDLPTLKPPYRAACLPRARNLPHADTL